MDLKELNNVDPNSHWYYLAKFEALKRSLLKNFQGSKILDIGAGSGFFALKIAKNYALSYSEVVCFDPNYDENQIGANEGATFINKLTPEQIENADLILLIDVLEHVFDEKTMLHEIFQQAKNGALFLVSVPAFDSLWSDHDVYLEHFRRYRLKNLLTLIKDLDAEVIDVRYLFGLIFPIVWAVRRLRLSRTKNSDLRKTNRFANKFLRFFLSIEHKYLVKNKLFGVSAYMVFRKL